MNPPLADVIDIAINELLWNGKNRGDEDFSCDAVMKACPWEKGYDTMAARFLESLGCNRYKSSLFDEFPMGPKRQYARALWLTWAAMIAREEQR